MFDSWGTLRGKCTICGVEGMLRARCTRCYKHSCDKPDCVKLIKRTADCRGERNDTGDRITAGKRLD